MGCCGLLVIKLKTEIPKLISYVKHFSLSILYTNKHRPRKWIVRKFQVGPYDKVTYVYGVKQIVEWVTTFKVNKDGKIIFITVIIGRIQKLRKLICIDPYLNDPVYHWYKLKFLLEGFDKMFPRFGKMWGWLLYTPKVKEM